MNARLLLIAATALGGLCHATLAAAPGAGQSDSPVANPKLDSAKDPITESVSSDAPAPINNLDQAPRATIPVEPQGTSADAGPTVSQEVAKPEGKAPAEPQQGPTVQVEKLQTASGPVDPKTVKILAPFPAKPLAPIPAGWRLDASNHAPTFSRKVELAAGASVILKISPQVLVPDADGEAVFSIKEPGYDPALGYQQSRTVSHILTNSIRQLDDDAKELGNAIERLQQLLGSLPHPSAQPPPPLSNTKLTDKR